MAVNVEKNKFIIFRTHGKPIPNENVTLKFDDNEPGQLYNLDYVYDLERIHNNYQDKNKRAYKLLGIYLDKFLSFNVHINHLCNKLSKTLHCINRAKNFFNLKSLKLLYFALIQSHLNYCSIILQCMRKKLTGPSHNVSKI